ncbi:hypothetical protein CRG98_012836 [Punica granatum]|uniref:Uncharacterized protein n=1 Tax=Punica granatum TaxID=22663 RepID=A0A2I0KEX8_PUNGR|nr:hypothetical protein CRG98_012836 [Punica granatum]
MVVVVVVVVAVVVEQSWDPVEWSPLLLQLELCQSSSLLGLQVPLILHGGALRIWRHERKQGQRRLVWLKPLLRVGLGEVPRLRKGRVWVGREHELFLAPSAVLLDGEETGLLLLIFPQWSDVALDSYDHGGLRDRGQLKSLVVIRNGFASHLGLILPPRLVESDEEPCLPPVCIGVLEGFVRVDRSGGTLLKNTFASEVYNGDRSRTGSSMRWRRAGWERSGTLCTCPPHLGGVGSGARRRCDLAMSLFLLRKLGQASHRFREPRVLHLGDATLFDCFNEVVLRYLICVDDLPISASRHGGSCNVNVGGSTTSVSLWCCSWPSELLGGEVKDYNDDLYRKRERERVKWQRFGTGLQVSPLSTRLGTFALVRTLIDLSSGEGNRTTIRIFPYCRLFERTRIARGFNPNHKSVTNIKSGYIVGYVRTRISSRRGMQCARLNATRLGSVHLNRDARRTHVRKSRHYLFTIRRSRAGELPGSRGMGYT